MTVARRRGRTLEPVGADDLEGVPGELARSPDTCAWRVRGDFSVEEEVRDGDVILVQSAPPARDGDTVAVLVEGEAMVRRFCRRDGKVMLRAAGEGLAAVVAKEEDVDIRGVVVAVVRKYE